MNFKNKFIIFTLAFILIFLLIPINKCYPYEDPAESELKEDFEILLEDLFAKRNLTILSADYDNLKEFYDLNIKVSLWAYEYEVKRQIT